MEAARRGLAAEELLARPLTPGVANQIRQHHHASIEQLCLREADCDVEISSWIDRHHREIPLVHTINHHTHAPLQELLRRVLGELNLSADVDLTAMDPQEYFGDLSIPILPWIVEPNQQQEKFRWAETALA